MACLGSTIRTSMTMRRGVKEIHYPLSVINYHELRLGTMDFVLSSKTAENFKLLTS